MRGKNLLQISRILKNSLLFRFVYTIKKFYFEHSVEPRYRCGLELSPRPIYSLEKGFIFAKGSPYRELFDYHIGKEKYSGENTFRNSNFGFKGKLNEGGVLNRLGREYTSGSGDREGDCQGGSGIVRLGYSKAISYI